MTPQEHEQMKAEALQYYKDIEERVKREEEKKKEEEEEEAAWRCTRVLISNEFNLYTIILR